MTKSFLCKLMLCVVAFSSASPQAQDVATSADTDFVISSGVEGGGYWNAAARMSSLLESMGLRADNRSSTGSLSNLRALVDVDSPVNVTFAQADALEYFFGIKPGADRSIQALESIGEECVFVISDAKGDIKDDKDMQDAPRLHLGIKSPNSGIRVTFDYMASVVPEFQNISILYGNAVDMMSEFEHPLTNIERAVMVVHRPDARSPEIDMVVANPDKYRLVKIRDERLAAKNSSGEEIYRRTKVKPSAVSGARAIETICVRGLLLVNDSKLTTRQREALKKLLDNHWDDVGSIQR